MQIKFESKQHRNFFMEKMQACKNQDSYHQAIFYALGINQDCRDHFQDVFDMKHDRIKPDGLNMGWQTSGSVATTLLAFNLWNGFTIESDEKASTPYELFSCGHAPYFFEAIKLRYPDYCMEHQSRNHDANLR